MLGRQLKDPLHQPLLFIRELALVAVSGARMTEHLADSPLRDLERLLKVFRCPPLSRRRASSVFMLPYFERQR
jgi:hypothetical protein